MANKKISELTELTAPADADLYPIVDDSETSGEQTKKVTHANLQTAILNHATALTLSIADTGQVQVTDGAVLPVTDDDVDLGSSDYQFKRGYFDDGITVNGVSQGLDVTAAIHRKILNIGAWNMDATSSVNVTHGLTLSKIRSASVMVTNDDGTAHYPISTYSGITDPAPDGEFYIGSSYVTISRRSSGGFDNAEFDYPSGNRGWVIIDYVS